MPDVAFRPRRLGHINLYVSQLDRSIAFYEKTCGIELVRIEAAIRGGFHSNGNTHHDIGLIEISKGVDRIGRAARAPGSIISVGRWRTKRSSSRRTIGCATPALTRTVRSIT
jgi:catechol 2,3-dioxygenase-like lactoylglutathione lyase family enzyme